MPKGYTLMSTSYSAYCRPQNQRSSLCVGFSSSAELMLDSFVPSSFCFNYKNSYFCSLINHIDWKNPSGLPFQSFIMKPLFPCGPMDKVVSKFTAMITLDQLLLLLLKSYTHSPISHISTLKKTCFSVIYRVCCEMNPTIDKTDYSQIFGGQARYHDLD